MIPRRHWLSFKPVAHSFHVVDTQKIAFTLKCGRGHSPVTMASSSDTYLTLPSAECFSACRAVTTPATLRTAFLHPAQSWRTWSYVSGDPGLCRLPHPLGYCFHSLQPRSRFFRVNGTSWYLMEQTLTVLKTGRNVGALSRRISELLTKGIRGRSG